MIFSNKYREMESVEEQNSNFIPEEMSAEDSALIVEAALCENLSKEELEGFLENAEAVSESINSEILLERSIVKLDKKAKLSQAQKVAIFTVAREKKDPKFKKLVTLWKIEKKLENYLEKKYAAEGLRRAKKALTTKKPKSKVVSKAIDKAKSLLNGNENQK